MGEPYIFNIQKFSLQDGPGIRTTVFFKGCPMRCLWCHNPEGQAFGPEEMGDGKGGRSVVGKRYAVGELLKICQQDQIFYDQSGGGVTLSGGEVMAQDMGYVEEVLQGLEHRGIPAALDTCGCGPREAFARVLAYQPLFLYDLKVMDEELHQACTGVPLQPVLDNLRYLCQEGARVVLRLIMIKDLNMDKKILTRLRDWLKEEQMALEGISLLPYHVFGRDKYMRLGREAPQEFGQPEQEELLWVKGFFEEAGYGVSIG